MTEIIPAPFLGNVFKQDLTGIVFDIQNAGAGALLSWSGLQFDPGYIPVTLSIGKEYSGKATVSDAKTCPNENVSCIPSPDNQALPLPGCFTEAWDSPLYGLAIGAGDIVATSGTLSIPYNTFYMKGAANQNAIETNGEEETYYFEMAAMKGAQPQKIKFLFKFTPPEAHHDPCGIAPETPGGTEPAYPDKNKGKGHGKKD